MKVVQSYKDLIVWQKGINLVSEIYKVTERFPKSEMFGLTSQIRRAAVSIPANLAEGYGRKHWAEYAQFVRIAFGSEAELETHLLIAQNIGFIKKEEAAKAEALLNEVMRMLNKLSSSLVAIGCQENICYILLAYGNKRGSEQKRQRVGYQPDTAL